MKRTVGIVGTVGLCALSAFLLSCGSSSSRPQGLLYVISDSASPPNPNSISSFTINLNNGQISLINSNATTCTNSTGCGLTTGVLLDPTKTVLYVLNEGLASAGIAPTIYSYSIQSDGSLGSPTVAATLSVGQTAEAMALDTGGDLLFVIVQGSNSAPADCPANTLGDCPEIVVFQTSPGKTTVTQASTFALDRMPDALSAITFTPPAPNNTQQTLLFVTSNLDLTTAHNDNELSVYAADSSGNLTEQGNSPYTTAPTPQVVLAVNTNAPTVTTGGVFVYVGTQGSVSGAVSAFQLCTELNQNGCTQSQVQGNHLNSIGGPVGAGNSPVAMLVDPTNSFLYVASRLSSQVFGFQIATGAGTLTQLSTASQPTGSQPVGMAIHPNFNNSAEFLYTSNYNGNSITGFTLGVTTGILSNATTTLFEPGLPSGIAAK